MTDWPDIKEGPCPHRQADGYDCLLRRIMSSVGPSICAFVNPKMWRDACDRFYRMCSLRDIAPGLWGEEGRDFCCHIWQLLFLKCAEGGGGHLQGAFDIRIYPNDGKDVWRNYYRVRFTYCPFCGKKARPSPEQLRRSWEALKEETRR